MTVSSSNCNLSAPSDGPKFHSGELFDIHRNLPPRKVAHGQQLVSSHIRVNVPENLMRRSAIYVSIIRGELDAQIPTSIHHLSIQTPT